MLPLPTLLKSGFTPTLKDFNNLLLFVSQNRRFKTIQHIFSQFRSNKINVDAHTHTIFTNALLKQQKYEEAADFLKTLADKSLIFDKHRLFDSLVRGLCTHNKDPEKGFSLLKDFLRINGGFFPSSTTFCLLIGCFSKMGKMDWVIDLLELICDDKLKYPFDNFVCSCVISGFVRIGEPELAVGFYETALKSDSFMPNIVTCTALLNAYCKLGNLDKVSDLVSWIENNELALDVVFYSDWIYGCFREGLICEAFQRFREMVDRKVELDNISYTILIDGFCKNGNVEKAVGFLYKMRKDGLEPNLVTYTSLILGFCKKGKLDEAFMIFNLLKKLGIEPDEFTYAILIHGVCRRGDFDLVFELLDEMEKKEINPSVVTYNTVINGLCKVGRTSEADDFSKSIVGDVVTYTTLLQGYVKEHNNTGIFETKLRLEAAGIDMDVIMCNVLIKAMLMVGLFDDARAIYNGMNLWANSVTYCTLIDGYCKAGRINEAFEIFDEFRKTSISSATCYHCIISWLCEKGMVDMAINVFIEYLKKGGPPLDRTMYMMLIEAVLNRNDVEGKNSLARMILTMFVKVYGLFDHNRVSQVVLNYLCLHDVKTALVFLNESKQIIPISVFKALMNNGRVCDAYKLLMGAENNLPHLDVVHYSIMVDALCKGGDIVKALDLCTLAKKKGISLNIVTYNSVINGLCRQGCLVEAFRLFDSLERINVLPTGITYGTLIDALVKEGLVRDARKLFERMFLENLTPTTHIYNSLINGYCKMSLVEEALELFRDLEMRNIEPDGFTVSEVINGYCQKGDMEGALKLFFEFKSKELLPDFLGFMYLVRGLCSKGRMEESRSVLREMVRAQSVIDLLSRVGVEGESESVVNILIERGSIDEAVAVLEEVGSIFFPRRLGSPCIEKAVEYDDDDDDDDDDGEWKDFDSFYCHVYSLCLKGDIGEANRFVKLLMNHDS